MVTLNQIAIRLYRRVFGSADLAALDDGARLVMDGNSAVALTTTALGAVLEKGEENPGERAALASAIGRALAGQRTAVFVSGPQLAGALDLLHNAAGRHLPLVVHLANRALPVQGTTSGSGHEALHLAAESGCAVFIAANVQEAVDLTVIAHRVAEQALLPVVVAMDTESTALSAQDVSLPPRELLAQFTGDAGEQIPCPTPAQQMLFGETRRRVPRWHDLDQPQLCGSRQSAGAFALGAIASGPFFEEHLSALVDDAFTEFSRRSGRPYSRVYAHRMDAADEVLLVQGAAAETARTVADHLAGQSRKPLGVLSVRCLRPSPAAKLVEQLAGRKVVAVLERSDNPLAGDPPLLRELRAALDRAVENQVYGPDTHPTLPALEQGRRPRLHSVIYGSGGLALRGADLLVLGEKLRAKAGPPLLPRLFLGIDFHTHGSDHPKRQVMLDRLRRAYPQVTELGLRGTKNTDLRPDKALGIAVHRRQSDLAHTVAGDAGALLQCLAGGRTRTRLGDNDNGDDAWSMDRLLHTPVSAGYPGDDFACDAAVVLGEQAMAIPDLCKGLREGGVILLRDNAEPKEIWWCLGASNQACIRRLDLKVFQLSSEQTSGRSSLPQDPMAVELRNTRVLGGLFAALLAGGLLEHKHRKLMNAWEETLSGLDDGDRDALKNAFESGLDAITPCEYPSYADSAVQPGNDETPQAVRHLGGSDESYDSLPRFWDQVGVLYREGEAGRLTADPYMATGTVPPLSATFRDPGNTHAMLPAFDAGACSGCGDCWSICPDSAIGTVALSPGALINAAIGATKSDALRPLTSKLAGHISVMGREQRYSGAAADELLRQAWSDLQEQSPLPAARLANVQSALDKTVQWLGSLPLAVTDSLFHSGEKEKKNTGELLSLVINPDACKACGLCIKVCGEDALRAEPRDTNRLQQARSLWRTWQATPDTGSGTIERAANDDRIGSMAALLLSRSRALAMTGGDSAEAGCGEKVVLRLALAVCENQRQPLQQDFTAELGEAADKVSALVRDTLTKAVPTDDLDALAASLQSNDDSQLDLSSLSGSNDIETADLRRLVDLARDLSEQHEQLSGGRHAPGRARFGLAVTGSSVADWACAFPNNPFHAPVVLDMTADPQLATGVLQGQIAETIRSIGLLEQARKKLDGRGQVAGGSKESKRLCWADLNHEQRKLCPPLLLVGNEAELGGKGFSQVTWLLNSGLPVKILVLSELDLGLDTRRAKGRPATSVNDPRTNLGLMALAQRNAYVAQTSFADTRHFHDALYEALSYTGPALVRAHAPSPQRHGFACDQGVEQARLAVASRTFPLFRYHPEGEGVFGSRLDLSGNPEGRLDWVVDEQGRSTTPIDWALTETRFAGHFSPLSEDADTPTEVLTWLALDGKARKNKTPFIELTNNEDVLRYRVSAELLERVGHLRDAWRTLQELGGFVTPFTERVQREADERVASERQAELDATRRDYEQQLADQRNGMRTEVSGQIKQRLLTLAGYK